MQRFIAEQCDDGAGQPERWLVHDSTDPQASTVFSGPNAERRAFDYARQQNEEAPPGRNV